jgi:hypothetical protein
MPNKAHTQQVRVSASKNEIAFAHLFDIFEEDNIARVFNKLAAREGAVQCTGDRSVIF